MSAKAAKKKAPAKKGARKKAEKKEDEAPAEAPAPAVVMGPAPVPRVRSRYNGTMHERRGKGYSPGELATVGLTRTVALSLGVSVDVRRRSVLQENSDALKGWYKPPPPKKRTAETEEEPKQEKKKPKKKPAAKKTKKA